MTQVHALVHRSMARTSGYPLADKALDGRLGELLLEWEAIEGESLFTIALRLRTEHGIEVSPSTVRRWTDRARSELAAAS